MKKFVLSCVCMLLLAMGTTALAAPEAAKAVPTGNPVEQLTGKIWMESSMDVKKALLFGVECAIAIEHAVADKVKEAEKFVSKRGKKDAPVSTLSPFERDWAAAFTGVPRNDIVERIDSWYTANPDKLERPVFDVIWFEIIEPKTKK